MPEKNITIFTDGGSRGNPGPGGYGAVIYDEKNGHVTEIGGYEKNTTNNRMELRAAIEALLALRKIAPAGDDSLHTIIHTDSAYLLNGITRWVKLWEKNNWMTGQKEGVLNQDLWQALLELSRDREVKGGLIWKKVSGHSGILGNERADTIATSSADQESVLLFSGKIDEYETMLGGPILDTTPKKAGKKTASSADRRRGGGKGYSYVSFVDGKLHIDTTWAECEKRVKGVKGAKYKKAMSKEEEEILVKEWSAHPTT